MLLHVCEVTDVQSVFVPWPGRHTVQKLVLFVSPWTETRGHIEAATNFNGVVSPLSPITIITVHLLVVTLVLQTSKHYRRQTKPLPTNVNKEPTADARP